MTHEEAVGLWLKPDGVGVEIGAFESPVPLIKPFYVDRFAEFAGRPCHADYWGDACRIPFRSNSLDYVVTSHVLEHVANPVAALMEWHRVVKDEGIIYMVLPDRRFTFDHQRELTTAEHMWHDYERGVTQRDSTHVHEYLDKVDWPMLRPDVPSDEIPACRKAMREQYIYDVQHNKEFNMHFHVFDEQNLFELVTLVAEHKKLSWTIMDQQIEFPDECPNGILMVIHVRKKFWSRLFSKINKKFADRNRNSVLKFNAKPLSDAEKMLRIYD